MDVFVKSCTLKDYFKLMRKLKEKFTTKAANGKGGQTPWADRKGDPTTKRQFMCTVNNAVSIACGGTPRQFLHEYANQNNEFIKPVHGPAYECPDCVNMLNNLKVAYDRLAHGNHHANVFRFTILQCLRVVRGYENLKKRGWEVGEEHWRAVGETITWSEEASDHARYRGAVTFT